MHSKGNHPSKFQLPGVSRFGDVREKTNIHTDRLTHSLTDLRFYRVSISMAKDQYFENLSRKAFLARKCSNEETNVSNLLQTLIFIIVIFYDAMMIVTLNITRGNYLFSQGGGEDSSPSPKGRRPTGLLTTTSGAGIRLPPPRFLGGEGFSHSFLGKIDTS